MSSFSGPAAQRTDARLFKGAGTSLTNLQKQSRKDLRNKARNEYWQAVQASNAVASRPVPAARPDNS